MPMGKFGPDLTHLMSRETHRRRGRAPTRRRTCGCGSKTPTPFKPGSLMPAMQLSDQEIDAVTAYLMTLH